MKIQAIDQSPRNHRGGQISHLLLAPGQFGVKNVAITWVEGQPGSEQPVHSHPNNEQVYVIVQGRGIMTVGDETREVGQGTAVLVPLRQATPYAIPEKNGSSLSPRLRRHLRCRPPTAPSHTRLQHESLQSPPEFTTLR